jgi:hypothetical protein
MLSTAHQTTKEISMKSTVLRFWLVMMVWTKKKALVSSAPFITCFKPVTDSVVAVAVHRAEHDEVGAVARKKTGTGMKESVS